MAARLNPALAGNERGNSLVEFALVLPLLLLVIAGMVDFGFLFQRYEVITNAAREGARLAVLPGYTTADVENRVRAYVREGLSGDATDIASRTTVALAPVAVAPGVGAAFTGAQVTVTFNYDYLLLGFIVNLATGGDFGRNITIRAVSTMRPEVSS